MQKKKANKEKENFVDKKKKSKQEAGFSE